MREQMRINELDSQLSTDESVLNEFNFVDRFLTKIFPNTASEVLRDESFKKITKDLRNAFVSKYKSKPTYKNAITFAKELKVDPEFINEVLKNYKKTGGFENISSDQKMGKKEQVSFFAAISAAIVDAGGINKVAPGEYKRKEEVKPEEKTKKETNLPDYIQSKLDKLSDEQKRKLLGMLQ